MAQLSSTKVFGNLEVTGEIKDGGVPVVTTTDTQTLTNKTLTSPKINEDVVITATSTEINYVDGVTSNIQTQLNSKVDDSKVLTDVPANAKFTDSKVIRFIIGTSTSGWTSANCDYLCDGVDDQVEINNAITNLPATGGEIIILDGTYNIAAKININKSNVNITGNSNVTILKRMYNSTIGEGLITLTSAAKCKVSSLYVDGNSTNYSNSNNYNIYLNLSNDNTIINNICTNAAACGVSLNSSNDNTIVNNNCSNNSDSGIYLNSSDRNIVSENFCTNNLYKGIVFASSSDDNTVTSNICIGNEESGIILSSSNNNTVTGNTCNNSIWWGGIDLSSSNKNTVTGNTCNDNQYGINLSASNNNTISNNSCIRGTGTSGDYVGEYQYTIQLYGTDNNYNLISSNSCMGREVAIGGGTGNTAFGNKFDATSNLKASDVGLGNVTNESKATMFTSPAFTNIPTAPTAPIEIDTDQIATTKFVQQKVTSLSTTANISYWVSTTGSDNNDGKTSGTAFATVQKAIDSVPKIINHTVMIRIADGAYDELVTISGFMGSGALILRGNISDRTKVTIGRLSVKHNTANISISYLLLRGMADFNSIEIRRSSYVEVYSTNCEFDNKASSSDVYHVYVTDNSFAMIYECTISNGKTAIGVSHAVISLGLCVGTNNNTVLFANTAGIIYRNTASSLPSGTIIESRSFSGQILSEVLNSNYLNENKADKDTPTILVSSSKTFALTDRATIQKCLSASPIIATIPTNASVAFTINTEIVITRYGAGTVTINPDVGVTLYSSDSKTSINKQYEAVTLKKIATDEWLLIGSLA